MSILDNIMSYFSLLSVIFGTQSEHGFNSCHLNVVIKYLTLFKLLMLHNILDKNVNTCDSKIDKRDDVIWQGMESLPKR